MARRFVPPDTLTATLEGIVEAQIAECRALLHATRQVEQAMGRLDFEAVDRAMADRARAMGRIRELEAEAAELRGRAFEPPPGLETRLAELRSLVQAVERADQKAREAAEQALQGIRRQLRELARGRQGLQGYRPHGTPLPRFTDRRG